MARPDELLLELEELLLELEEELVVAGWAPHPLSSNSVQTPPKNCLKGLFIFMVFAFLLFEWGTQAPDGGTQKLG